MSLSLFGYGNDAPDPMMADPITPLEVLKKSDAFRSTFELFIMKIQHDFCRALEDVEKEDATHGRDSAVPSETPATFRVDRWERKSGGGGITCILEEGRVFEKAGVNISVVEGVLPPAAVAQMRSRGRVLEAKEGKEGKEGLPFFAAGVSSVIHPRNPNVPTVHFK